MRGIREGLFLLFSLCGITSALWCGAVPGQLKQIDAGNGQVVGVNAEGNIYTLYKRKWTQIPGALIHVTTGPAGIWGVNKENNVYKLVGGDWKQVTGSLKRIDAGGSQFVVGVNKDNDVYCLPKSSTVAADGNSALNWIHVDGNLKYYSCGPLGCWGVNSLNIVHYRYDVTPENCAGSRWEIVPGQLSMIEVGTQGDVYGVNRVGNLFRRVGISAGNPVGTNWEYVTSVSIDLKHVSYDLGLVWILTKDGMIFDCQQNLP